MKMQEIVWDRREEYVYMQVEKTKFVELRKKCELFLKNLDDPSTTPFPVYIMKPKQLEELQLIRDVSKYLQKKKEDDMNKAKADAEAEIKKQEDKQNEQPAEETTEDQNIKTEEHKKEA